MSNKTLKQIISGRDLSANQKLTHTSLVISVTNVRTYLLGIVTNAHIHLSETQRIIVIN